VNELEQSLAYIPEEGDIDFVKRLPAEDLPKISVVMPSYNQVSFLQQALDSILSQEYPHLEIYVADGGSSDGSVEILKAYKRKHKKIIRYVSEPDEGQYHAVNKCIDATDGDIIAWLNSDDVYLTDTFWKVATFFYFNRCALVAYGRNRYTDENLVPIIDYPVDWSPMWTEQKRRMMHFCLPPQPSLFFHRMATVLLGKLVSPILDYELWLRWQRDVQFYFIDDYLSLSRLHSEAQTVKNSIKLIHGICEVVHQYYWLVPYSWTVKRAYTEAYGSVWEMKDPPPVTRHIRMKAWFYWIYYNLRWAPRSLKKIFRVLILSIKESIFGRV
jgi:glycosyltransferase involved in cell wall biosynthesis